MLIFHHHFCLCVVFVSVSVCLCLFLCCVGRKCETCGEGMLRDSVIHFHESLPARDLERSEQHARESYCSFVMGKEMDDETHKRCIWAYIHTYIHGHVQIPIDKFIFISYFYSISLPIGSTFVHVCLF